MLNIQISVANIHSKPNMSECQSANGNCHRHWLQVHSDRDIFLSMCIFHVVCTGTVPHLCTAIHTPLRAFCQLGFLFFISARCNIYISRLCYDVSVRLSVTEVHWRIVANLGFKFRSQFTVHCGRGACSREGRDHRREEWRDHLVLC